MHNAGRLSKIPIYRSIYFRLALYFSALILAVGLLQLYVAIYGFRDLSEEVLQQLNWDSGTELANRLQPFLIPEFNLEVAEQQLYELTLFNPVLEVYLLDKQGEIKARRERYKDLKRTRVNLEPLLQALEFDAPVLPLKGEDPLTKEGLVPFAVANIKLGSEDGYLYVVLNSLDLRYLVRMSGQFFVTRTMTWGFWLTALGAVVLGLILFRLLTAKFREVSAVLEQFAQGDFSKRLPVATSESDEIGALASTVNYMADAVVESRKAIEDRDAKRRELVATIAHDLRSPLLAMQWHLERAMDYAKAQANPELENMLQLAYDSASFQNTLTDDLFELSKLEARERQLELDLISPQNFAESILARLGPAAAAAEITLSCVPEAPDLPDVLADPQLLARAMTNLLENALRYAGKGGSVQVKLKPAGDRVEVAICDSGVGIAEEQQDKVMQAFYQADPQSRGAGLGLAIVKRIAELHGSQLTLQSTVGVGTTFSFSLQADPGE